MAHELFPTAHGAVLRGELEQTYNSSPTIADGDVYRCPLGATFNSYVRSVISRQTQAGFISGVRASRAVAMGEYSIQALLDHQTISSPDLTTEGAMTSVPQCDIFLRGGGWQAAHANNADYSGLAPDTIVASAGNNDEILTYTYKPRTTGVNFTSARWNYTEISEGGEGWLHDMVGARHGWTLNMPGGDHWSLDCTGKSLAYKPTKVTTPSLDDSFDDNEAVVGLGANYGITKIVSTASTFGKSSHTANASTLAAYCHGMSLASNLEVQERIAPNGSYGVAQIRFVAGVPRLTLTLDQVLWSDDWDLYTFFDDGRAIQVTHAVPAPGSTTDFIVFDGTFQIVNITPGEDGGYRNAQLELDYLFNDNSSDGGGLYPAPGITLKWVSIVSV